MRNIKKLDETDIYSIEHNNIELDADVEIKEVDEITLKRIEGITLRKAGAMEGKENAGISQKKKGFRAWFQFQSRIQKAGIIVLFLIVVSGAALGFITLLNQYVPGIGIVSDSSRLLVLKSPYTVWKDDYYLRITSLSYNPDTRELKFTAESNGADALGYDTGEKIISGGIYFKEKWSQATPFTESTGKGYYNFGNLAAEYHDEYKLKKELEDYYLELDLVDKSNSGGKVVYTEKPEYIVISFGDLKLVPAVEADEIKELGQVFECSGVSGAAVSRWDKGNLYTDILFKCSDAKEKVVSFNGDKVNDITLVADDGKIYKNMSGQSMSSGWKYLLFETKEPVNGTVLLKSLLVEKSLDKSIKLEMPGVGETMILNREVEADGFKIIIESIRAYRETVVYEGGKSTSYVLPDNEIGIDVKCRIIEGTSNGRTAYDKSYIKGELMAGNAKSSSKSISWGSSGLSISGRFNSEQIKDASEITLVISDIMLKAEGNWSIPIVVK